MAQNTPAPAAGQKPKKVKKSATSGMSRALVRRETTSAYLFLLPSLIFFVTFVVVPMFICVYYSFTDYGLGGVKGFAGLSNYIKLFQDPVFHKGFINTVIIVVVELFAPVFVSAFTSDPEAAHYAVLNLRVEIVGQIFYAIFLVYHALMLGAGDTWWVFLSSFANCIVFRVVLSILFEHFWGVEGIYAACAIAPSISVPVGMYYTRSNRWRKSLAKPAREGE